MDIYQQYAQLKFELSRLESIEENLKVQILCDMKEKNLIKEEFEFGKFTVGSRKTYTYSDKVKDLEDRVKLAKQKEVDKGLAEVKETNYVIFKS